jgi:hypothetical protein
MNRVKWITKLVVVVAACGVTFGADQAQRIKIATILPRGTSGQMARGRRHTDTVHRWSDGWRS